MSSVSEVKEGKRVLKCSICYSTAKMAQSVKWLRQFEKNFKIPFFVEISLMPNSAPIGIFDIVSWLVIAMFFISAVIVFMLDGGFLFDFF